MLLSVNGMNITTGRFKMKKNINRIIDLTLNEDILKEFLGEYEITKDWNIKTKSWKTVKVEGLSKINLKKAIVFDYALSMNDILKIVSFLPINGSNKWRLPTSSELKYIFRYAYREEFNYIITCWAHDGFNEPRDYIFGKTVSYDPSISFGNKIEVWTSAPFISKHKIILVR